MSVGSVGTRSIDPLCGSVWEELLKRQPGASFFHSSAWAKVLAATYGHKPLYMGLTMGSEVVGLLPIMEVRSSLTGRRGVCLPFTDACGPLMTENLGKSVTSTLLDLARDRNWRYFELRGPMGHEFLTVPAAQFYGHSLGLCGSEEQLLRTFGSSVRRAIRKAQTGGLTTEVAQSRDAIFEFFSLHARTRRRHGLPPPPRLFFENIYDEILKTGSGFIVLARIARRAIAAAIFFHFEKHAVYKFGASDERFQDVRGNNLVMWEGIKHLARLGCETLDLGRTSLQNNGLRRFKLGWGAQEEVIKYFKFDILTEAWVIARDRASGLHNAIFSRLPLRLNRMIGAMIYPHLD